MDELHRRMVRHIRELAKAQKIPLTHLPDHAGVSKAHFFEVIAGRKSPTVQWLARLAEALGVDIVDLLAPETAS